MSYLCGHFLFAFDAELSQRHNAFAKAIGIALFECNLRNLYPLVLPREWFPPPLELCELHTKVKDCGL
jgi:hypothetical protein